MINGNRIIFVSLVDNRSQSYENLSVRIWNHEEMVKKFLQNENCVMGRRTHELTQWKGPKSWVLTHKKNWKSIGIGTIHKIEDFHLWMEGDIYILGGTSLFRQMESYVDEIHLFVFNAISKKITDTDTNWIKLNMQDWAHKDYLNRDYWSYVNLSRIETPDFS